MVEGEISHARELRDWANDIDEKAVGHPDWVPMFLPGGTRDLAREHAVDLGDTAKSIAAALRVLADIVETDDAADARDGS